MILMTDNEVGAAYTQRIQQAVVLVPGATRLYSENRLEELLQLLTTVRNNARTEAQKLRARAKVAADEAEKAELEEEASDVEEAERIIGHGVFALDLCST